MSSKQLIFWSFYQAKLEEKCYLRKGLITIWNPTEQQVITSVLQCVFQEIVAFNFGSQGPTAKWRQFFPRSLNSICPFSNHGNLYCCTISLKFLSQANLILRDLSFSWAGVHATCYSKKAMGFPDKANLILWFVVLVGTGACNLLITTVLDMTFSNHGVHATANQIKRWVFMTECSVHESHSKRRSKVLLVIRFCAQTAGHDLYLPISHNLVVSMNQGWKNIFAIGNITDRKMGHKQGLNYPDFGSHQCLHIVRKLILQHIWRRSA
ncbi:uncharacterized protein LOC108193394 [Daucus carota subsp. sativus]|uniref:uncharacterized protein LOC108193394 n=1 Tax=Daucus carota subsp. sativus TaxID=79200 RepID=UPI003083E6CC